MDERIVGRLREDGILAAWLFGSRARGETTDASDVDLALLREAPLALLRQSRLAHDLGDILHARVDLLDFVTAPVELRARVVLEGQLLFSDDEPRRVAETVDTQSRWEDVRWGLAERDRQYLQHVATHGLD